VSINVSIDDPNWDAKVMSEFFIQMMHRQLGEGNERKCINAVRVFKALALITLRSIRAIMFINEQRLRR